MGDPAARLRMTEEEYLAFERASDEKHEFADGEIFAMSGGKGPHSNVAAAFIRDFGVALLGRTCRVYTSDMRIHIPSSGRFVYPDASVVCGRPQYKDEQIDTLLNPRVIVEVLSSSTEAYDRGDKFANYRTLPSLMHYIMAAQDKPFVEVYTRQDDGSWLLREYGPGTRIALSSPECTLEVDRIYTGVFDEFDVA
jgi:Uma2 family endonuclease